MKIFKTFIAAMLILLLFGNTALAAGEVADPAADTEAVAEPLNETDDLEVTQIYEHSSEWGYKYLIAVCKNKTDTDLEVAWDTISYDKAGDILETGSSYSAYVSGGQSFTLYALFLDSADADNYTYNINYEEARFIVPAYNEVTLTDKVSSNGKLILTATNNSNYDLNTIQAATLFFDENDNLVGFDDSYIVNSNYNVKAGETVVKDIRPPEEATSYMVYYTAYRY